MRFVPSSIYEMRNLMKRVKIGISVLFLILWITGCAKTNNTSNSISDKNIERIHNTIPIISITPQVHKHEYFISEDELQNHLEYICNEPRHFGSVGEKKASTKIIDILKEYQYDINSQIFSVYKQNFETTVSILGKEYFNLNPLESESLGEATNLIATKYSKNVTDKTLYITAHYDTIENTNGIIDNSSGVISVLQIAKHFMNVDLNFNVKFIFFSAEEYYRQGSRYYLNNLSSEERQNAIGCINIDMIGEKNAGEIVVKTVGKRTNLISFLFEEFTSYNIEDGGSSDDLSFYNAQIPLITLCNINPNLKRDIKLEIDLSQIKEITEELCYFIEYLSGEDLDCKLNEHLSVSKDEYNMNLLNNSKLSVINATKTFIGNGHETLTIYDCIYNDKENIQIIEQINLDLSLKELDSYQDIMIDVNTDVKYRFDTWKYQVNKQNIDTIKIDYVAGSRRGTIVGNITLNEAIEVLKRYYANYHIY